MADTYVDYATGNDTTGDGSSGNPYKTIKKATDTVTAGANRILVSNTSAESTGGAVTYTVAAGVRVISTSGISTTYASRGAKLTTANSNVTINGGRWHGFIFESTGTGSWQLAIVDGAQTILEDCKFDFVAGTSGATSVSFGGSGGNYNTLIELYNVDYATTNVGQGMNFYTGEVRWYGGTLGSGTAPTTLLESGGNRGVVGIHIEGCDLSNVSGTLVAGSTTFTSNAVFEFVNCKFHASLSARLGASATFGIEVWCFDCHSGDVHYNMEHYNYAGSTLVDTNVYASAGASYDGTNFGTSWLVSSNANATRAHPYRSPWIDRYSAAATITPNFECVRSGSATAYKDDEVWSEWMLKKGTNVPTSSFVSDECAVLGTAADQDTGALSGGNWTGENATSWFGKLSAGSQTLTELGYLRGRIVIGKASVTDLYVDPKIRIA